MPLYLKMIYVWLNIDNIKVAKGKLGIVPKLTDNDVGRAAAGAYAILNVYENKI